MLKLLTQFGHSLEGVIALQLLLLQEFVAHHHHPRPLVPLEVLPGVLRLLCAVYLRGQYVPVLLSLGSAIGCLVSRGRSSKYAPSGAERVF